MTDRTTQAAAPDIEGVAAQLRAAGTPHAVATVVRTLSSTAAKPGMKALVLEDGNFAEGWLGGGCVTSAVRRAAQQAIRSGEATLVCLRPEELLADEADGEAMVTLARNGCPSKGSMDIFVEPVVPQPELLVFGQGPVARALLRIASGFGFTLASFGDAVEGVEVDRHYDSAGDLAAAGNAERFIIIATQGAGDVASLTAALPLASDYLAFVGSRRKFASYRDKLLAAGLSAERIGDVRSPAGLHIDAVTPEEIALSIMAEVIQTRRSARRAEVAHG
ncbi:MAG: XdhC family protein [Pseudomonadota bacterium]|nr:XdhC family protein [Pseudomonadota bacterium]MEC7238152.1 XdhC family protein [Pseudomonadota bacterium]